MSLAAGQRLGPYEVIAKLGAGGMGEVFRARDTRLGREVALKILPADVANDPSRIARFEQEGRAVAALNHPNIVGVYDVGTQDGVFYIVSELVPGETLDAVMQRGSMTIKRVVDIAVQIADGMAAAHAVHITHRDLKPQNVMVTGDGRVKILDFGLAKQAKVKGESDNQGTVTLHPSEAGMIVGTVNYMSPEQAAGKPVDPRSDQFSFGLILYEMITGKRAFERPSAVQTMSAILTDDPPKIEREIPLPLRWALERCLAKEPDGRYESTRDLYRDLRSLREHMAQGSSSQEMAPVAAAPRQKKYWIPALFFVGGAVVALAVALLLPRGKTGADQDAFRFTPFSFEPGGQANPIWSPDGKAVAYAARGTSSRRYELYIRYLDQPAPLQIGKESATAVPLGWTPNGRILFYSGRDPAGIWSIAPVGGQPEEVLPLKDMVGSIGVSRDASAVAFLQKGADGLVGLQISAPPGSAPKFYSPAPFAGREIHNYPQVRFSPDGKQILVMISRNGVEEAWLLPYPADASKPPHQIWRTLQAFEGTPTVSWMPDNRHVVIGTATSSGAPTQLWMADIVSEERTVLLSGTISHSNPSVSPDGTRMVFSEATDDYDVISMNVADATATRLISSQRLESMPAWAAHQQALVYVTDRNGEYEIWLRKPETGDRPLVTGRDFPQSPTKWFMSPTLSPEGDRVIYGRLEENNPSRLWISSAAGGAPIALTNDAASNEYSGSWSPDGNWFIYLSLQNGKAALMRVKTSGQSTPEIVSPLVSGPTLSLPAWSPTGEWIAYDDRGVHLVSPDGKTKKSLDVPNAAVCTFASDGKSLLCIEEDRETAQLVSVNIATGIVRTIAPVSQDFRPLSNLNPALRLSLSPDGKSFVYPSGKAFSNLWILDGLSGKK